MHISFGYLASSVAKEPSHYPARGGAGARIETPFTWLTVPVPAVALDVAPMDWVVELDSANHGGCKNICVTAHYL